MARVWPVGSSCQTYIQSAPGVYTVAAQDQGTVTCFVRVASDANNVYMLTAGHVFRNSDRMFHEQCNPPANNQITGLPANRRDANQPDIYWAEPARTRGNQGMLARSVGQYHCAGDKLGSLVDAGLAGMLPANPPIWANQQSVAGGGRLLNAIEMHAPPQLPAGEFYYLGPKQMTGLVYRAGNFNANWVNESWNGTTPTQLRNVLVRPYVAGDGSNPAMSGQALVRGAPPPAGGGPVPAGTVVAICVGAARDLDSPSQDTIWEIYQHISEAVNLLGITGLA